MKHTLPALPYPIDAHIDYRNQRPKFVEAFLSKLVNWSFAEKNFG